MNEASSSERWCHDAREHGEHETRKNFVTGEQLYCAGVTRDEAVVLGALGRGAQRYAARMIIGELNKARGES